MGMLCVALHYSTGWVLCQNVHGSPQREPTLLARRGDPVQRMHLRRPKTTVGETEPDGAR